MEELLSNGIKKRSEKKNGFGNIEVYSFERTLNGKKNGTKEVYKITDKRTVPNGFKYKDLDVGVFITERFYFLFPWNECMHSDGTLIFKGLKGLIELAHGKRKDTFFKHNPFQPPAGSWKINWVGPHGSVANGAVDANMLTSRIFGISELNGNTNSHSYYGTNILINRKAECQEAVNKFKHDRKYVSGTNSTDYKIMNYRLDKFGSGYSFEEHFNNGVGLIQCSQEIGMVITRNRMIKERNLKKLLESIAKWNFPKNLVFSSCRHIEPKKVWMESENKGPNACKVLGGTVILTGNKASNPNAIGIQIMC
jgi:hypothetical protein